MDFTRWNLVANFVDLLARDSNFYNQSVIHRKHEQILITRILPYINTRVDRELTFDNGKSFGLDGSWLFNFLLSNFHRSRSRFRRRSVYVNLSRLLLLRHCLTANEEQRLANDFLFPSQTENKTK